MYKIKCIYGQHGWCTNKGNKEHRFHGRKNTKYAIKCRHESEDCPYLKDLKKEKK